LTISDSKNDLILVSYIVLIEENILKLIESEKKYFEYFEKKNIIERITI
jgi:hypothetical protein